MKLRTLISRLLFLVLIILLNSCAGDAKKDITPEKTTVPESSVDTVAETQEENNTYYAWVDNLNVRDAANTKGKVIGTYATTDPLEFTGTTSDDKETIVLRGVAYDDYWLKVKTNDSKEGWVFAGAVKKEGETKGNAAMTNEKFTFDHFGAYDLSTWTDLGVTNRTGGDAESTIYSYTNGDKILELDKTEVGEYGYYHTYRLLDKDRNVLKKRSFDFSANAGDYSGKMELTETVKDFQIKKQFERKQYIDIHFMSLNARPIMVNGEWKEVPLQQDSTEETKLSSE